MTGRSALLLLTPGERAVFSEQARSEGQHSTRACPPGAALLGWAARGYEGWLDRGKAEAIFHSGLVRFSDALPLTADGAPAYPVAQLLVTLKHRPSNEVRVVRGPASDEKIQYEAIKGKFVTRDCRFLKPEFGSRLRTATSGGRAELGKLFGFRHVEPQALRFAATVEADDGVLDDVEWAALLGAFDGRTLHLGRGANSAYGGAYQCKVSNDAGLWPTPGALGENDKFIRVWALSDFALVDEYGSPASAPSALSLGLEAGWRFCLRESVVSLRRYAPWNRKLSGRDVERQVVAAGSVFTFQREAGATIPKRMNSIVGFAREAGLGRVWPAPPMLQVNCGEMWKSESAIAVAPVLPNVDESAPAQTAAPPWLGALRLLHPDLVRGCDHEQKA
jgi:hypothetical protein